MTRSIARIALCAWILAAAALPAGATGDTTLRDKILSAYSNISSYKLTVLGQVRSNGVFVAPNRYQMTTEFQGKTIKTIFIGHDYWIYSAGKWQKSATPANNLDLDVTGFLRKAKAQHLGLRRLPDQVRDGKKLGTFSYTTSDATEETCNFDLTTYRVTRCKADQLTILYFAFNDPANHVQNP